MVDLVQAYFTKNKSTTKRWGNGLCDWTLLASWRVNRQLNFCPSSHSPPATTHPRCVAHRDIRTQAEIGADLEQQKEQLDRAGGYVELYGAYTECEATYQLDRMYVWNSLDEADQRDFNMDPLSIDWPHYAHDIQIPSTVSGVPASRCSRARGRRSTATSGSARTLSEDRHLAVFDLENTLIASNVVAS